MTKTDYLQYAMKALKTALDLPDLEPIPVWFCKTADNWKAILITDPNDSCIYEVTHVGSIGKTFVDRYQKVMKYTLEEKA